MRIAFHAPLKPPGHPTPSGDRLMARLLVAALEQAGNAVEIASELRTFCPDPFSDEHARILAEAEVEIERVSENWQRDGKPDLWFCYHPYYKSPDLIGPKLCRMFAIPYVTAEASYSSRRNDGAWAASQAAVREAIELAAVNLCFTARDRAGIEAIAPDAHCAMLQPFIDPAQFATLDPKPRPNHIVTVAMMRPGDKLQSYEMLAEALVQLPHLAWALSVVGTGPSQPEVRALFASLPENRIAWLGEQSPPEIAKILSTGALYAWPGFGEAYGLAYLEAQAAGLPVVAQAIAGVPEVVVHAKTGLLTPRDDVAAYAHGLERLLTDHQLRQELAANARQFVIAERSIKRAAAELKHILREHIG